MLEQQCEEKSIWEAVHTFIGIDLLQVTQYGHIPRDILTLIWMKKTMRLHTEANKTFYIC